jgi:hypothetical protein
MSVISTTTTTYTRPNSARLRLQLEAPFRKHINFAGLKLAALTLALLMLIRRAGER